MYTGVGLDGLTTVPPSGVSTPAGFNPERGEDGEGSALLGSSSNAGPSRGTGDRSNGAEEGYGAVGSHGACSNASFLCLRNRLFVIVLTFELGCRCRLRLRRRKTEEGNVRKIAILYTLYRLDTPI